jgi:hypothetical protein
VRIAGIFPLSSFEQASSNRIGKLDTLLLICASACMIAIKGSRALSPSFIHVLCSWLLTGAKRIAKNITTK